MTKNNGIDIPPKIFHISPPSDKLGNFFGSIPKSAVSYEHVQLEFVDYSFQNMNEIPKADPATGPFYDIASHANNWNPQLCVLYQHIAFAVRQAIG
jgi:hypothetical protein